MLAVELVPTSRDVLNYVSTMLSFGASSIQIRSYECYGIISRLCNHL